MARDRWKGNTVFVLAAIGSAIGLGNIWRFPFKCYEYGGGAFLVAYLFALFTAGIPLLAMEFGLGNMTQRGAPGAFRKTRRGLEWVGWWAILVGFAVVSYYVVVMGWCVDYLWFAVQGFAADTNEFFYKDFLGLTDSINEIGGFRWPILLGMLISWGLIVLCIWKGATTVGKVVWVTVLVPWTLLLVFVVRGVTLPGAGTGLRLYLFPEWGQLLNPQLWVAAYGQVFYSMSVGFGIMIAYSSFLPKKSNLVRNALIIGIGDALTAIIGGFAVFAVLGNIVHTTFPGVPLAQLIQEGKLEGLIKGGPGLAFVTYPRIISQLPWAGLFGVLFFLMLLTLAVDSAFSLTESVCAGIRDKWGLSHKTANFTVAGIGIASGLIFCTGAGLYWLDIVDKYLEFFGLVAVCLVEVVLLARYLKIRRLRDYLNSTGTMKLGLWWEVCLLIITPLTLAAVIVLASIELIRNPYEGYPQWALISAGWVLMALLPIAAFVISKISGPGDADSELPENGAITAGKDGDAASAPEHTPDG